MDLGGIFRKTTKPDAPVEAAETLEAARARRAEFLREELRRVDGELETLSLQIRKFRTENTAMIDGEIVFKCADLHGRAGLEQISREQLNNAGTLVIRKNRILEELAGLRPPEVSHIGGKPVRICASGVAVPYDD